MKSNRISTARINNTADNQSLNKIVVTGKVKTILVRNNNASPHNMYVGYNEDATDKVTVEPGEFIALSKDDGTFYDQNTITFVFAASDVANRGFVVMETEVETNDC